MTGPGEIYRLRFRASSTPQTTTLTFLEQKFYRGGLLVVPVEASGAVVEIRTPQLGVGEAPATSRLTVSAAPNPMLAGVVFGVEIPESGDLSITLLDVQGRVARRLGGGWVSSGTRQIKWDTTDESGVRIRPGVYRVVVHCGSSSQEVCKRPQAAAL